MTKVSGSPSSLRQDFISGDWVVVATGRAARPDEFKRKQKKKIKAGSPLPILSNYQIWRADFGLSRGGVG